MKLYRLLSGISALKSYSSKFMFVAFLGIHIPLLGIVSVLFATTGEIKKTSFFLITLGLTLLATVITLIILHSLTAPLRFTQKQLAGYLTTQNLPAIPTEFKDETGLLMRDISALVARQQELKQGLHAQSAEILSALSAISIEKSAENIEAHTKTIAAAVNKQLMLMDAMERSGGLRAA